MTHSLDASSQVHISNWIWAPNVHGDSLPGYKFTAAMPVIEFELRMSRVTHCLGASSQVQISNSIWALNIHDDSLPRCKFMWACEQLNLISECPWWLTPWIQVHRSISAIEFELRMSMVTHILDTSTRSISAIKFYPRMSRVTHCLDTSASSQEHMYQQSNLSSECQ